VKKSGDIQLRLATGVDSRNVLALRLWQSPIFSLVPVTESESSKSDNVDPEVDAAGEDARATQTEE
jgi:hypothetical protein